MYKFELQGTRYELDEDTVTLSQWQEVKKRTGGADGLTVLRFSAGIVEGDPAALQALFYLAKRSAGEKVLWDDLGSVTLGDFNFVREDPDADDPDELGESEEDAPDPTQESRTST